MQRKIDRLVKSGGIVMFFERTEEGDRELSEVGIFSMLILAGTLLPLIFATLHALSPGRNATSGGFVGLFILILLQAGRNKDWRSRSRLLAYAFVGYAWCVSLARVLTGGDMALYTWSSLMLLSVVPSWMLIDWRARRNRSETR